MKYPLISYQKSGLLHGTRIFMGYVPGHILLILLKTRNVRHQSPADEYFVVFVHLHGTVRCREYVALSMILVFYFDFTITIKGILVNLQLTQMLAT